jgi:hypothetical protein
MFKKIMFASLDDYTCCSALGVHPAVKRAPEVLGKYAGAPMICITMWRILLSCNNFSLLVYINKKYAIGSYCLQQLIF